MNSEPKYPNSIDEIIKEKMSKDLREEITLWKEFVEEIIHKNRFFPVAKAIEEIEQNTIPALADTIDIGSNKYYRVREFEEEAQNNYLSCSDSIFTEEEIKERSRWLFFSASHAHVNCDAEKIARTLTLMNPSREKNNVWGYSEGESGIPPCDKAEFGRANPKYIPYLYLATDIPTALSEKRAKTGQIFSVATYEIKAKLNVVNLAKKDAKFAKFMNVVFSSPSTESDKDYLVSQYISELIKKLGYDGVAFHSSQNLKSPTSKGGINLTLFSDKSCKFICSELYEVTRILVEANRLLPVQAPPQRDTPMNTPNGQPLI